jgi:hypothetical protein
MVKDRCHPWAIITIPISSQAYLNPTCCSQGVPLVVRDTQYDFFKCPSTCASTKVSALTYRFWVGMAGIRNCQVFHSMYCMPTAHRLTLHCLRLGCNDLRVVQGRRNNTPRHDRLCLLHSAFDARHTQVEDIRHFLLECPAYERIRTHPYFSTIFSCLHNTIY